MVPPTTCLTKMSTEGCEFDTVLKEAQAKGYAEADPTADVGRLLTHAAKSPSFLLWLMDISLIMKIFIQKESQRSHRKIWNMQKSLA